MIYIDRHIWDFDLSSALEQVSAWRHDYALRYRHELDQRLCVAVYLLLQRALRLEYGIEEVPVFIYNESGKPMLDGYPDIHFSLSHCADAVACDVSDKPVGIDIETLDHYDADVARRVMNNKEISQIFSSSHPDVMFTRFWTMKESLYKMKGNPLDLEVSDLLNNATDCCFTTIIHPTYVMTSCITK